MSEAIPPLSHTPSYREQVQPSLYKFIQGHIHIRRCIMSYLTLQRAKIYNSNSTSKWAYNNKLNRTHQTDNVVPAHARKGSEGIAPAVLNLDTSWR